MLKQSTAYTLTFFMVSSTDHLSAKTGASPVVNLSKAGAAFGAAGGTVTEIANGWYKVALTTTDTNTLGDLSLHITGTGADDTDMREQVIAVDLADATAFGLSRLDAAVSSRMATFTLPANFSALSISAGGLVDILQTAADKVWSTTSRTLSAFGFSVTVGTNNDKTGYSLSAAAVQAIWDALTSALTTVGSIGKLLVDNINATISSRSTYAGGDTAGTTTLLSRLTGTRATNLDNLDAAVSTRSTYAGGAVASVTGNVGGNVAGSVGSVAAGGIAASSFAAGAVDAAALATDAGQEIADRFLTRNLGGGSDTGRTVRQALGTMRNKVEIVAGTLTVYAEDDTTVLYTAAITTTAGNPVSAIDPA